MNNIMRKAVVTAAVALPLTLAAQVAQASLITSFNYDVESGFTSFQQNNDTGGTGVLEENTNTNINAPTKLSWGEDGGPRSSIEVTGSVPGTVQTNGSAVSGATFTHNNFTIPDEDQTLTQATLNNTLTLTSATPQSEAGSVDSKTFNFMIPFAETANVSGSCPAGSTGAPCDDVFVLTNPNGVTSFSFAEDGTTYTAALSITGFGPLSDEACADAGAASGCLGILTKEGQVNNIDTSFTVTANAPNPVPEPGALSIMGFGLIGLAYLGMRRRGGQG